MRADAPCFNPSRLKVIRDARGGAREPLIIAAPVRDPAA